MFWLINISLYSAGEKMNFEIVFFSLLPNMEYD